MSNARAPLILQIPQHGYVELEHLAKYADKLEQVIAISDREPLETYPAEISRMIAEQIGVDQGVAAILLRGLGTLRFLMEKNEATASEVVTEISQALTQEWRDKNLMAWQLASPAIIAALSSLSPDHRLILRRKAFELMYAHQNIFRRCQIMTDLRPVYDKAATTIHAMVLTHVLGIEYFDGVRRQRIEFALDEEDVDNLRKSAERAKTKKNTAKNKFEELNWPLMIAGDNVTEND